ACAQRLPLLSDDCDQLVDEVTRVLQAPLLANPGKNFVELYWRDSANFDLGLNSPEECRVGQCGRIQVGGENHKQLERNLNFSATRQRQKINAAIERDDPAVQKFVRAQALAPKIIDY